MKKGHAAIYAILIPIFLIIALVCAYFALSIMHPERKLYGEWRTDADLTAQARDNAAKWLNTAALSETVDISEYIENINIEIILTFSKDETYSERIEETSYATANETAYTAFAKALDALIAERIKAAGMRAPSAEEAEALVYETLGMSSYDYLREYGPQLLPSLSELQALYDSEGIYYIEERHTLVREHPTEGEDIAVRVQFITDGDMLVLQGEDIDIFSKIGDKGNGGDR